ncbi:hypothetical protein VP01_480g3 [Puccinia sorghi]|uniref:Uncharacterized protein n=1 Tax=Puccinia sorghi TaxID=27349 RepID=A0A0L6UNB1_9BASI|nr:hypothetical protein VP01_480g3 [Puccinia sorghi]
MVISIPAAAQVRMWGNEKLKPKACISFLHPIFFSFFLSVVLTSFHLCLIPLASHTGLSHHVSHPHLFFLFLIIIFHFSSFSDSYIHEPCSSSGPPAAPSQTTLICLIFLQCLLWSLYRQGSSCGSQQAFVRLSGLSFVFVSRNKQPFVSSRKFGEKCGQGDKGGVCFWGLERVSEEDQADESRGRRKGARRIGGEARGSGGFTARSLRRHAQGRLNWGGAAGSGNWRGFGGVGGSRGELRGWKEELWVQEEEEGFRGVKQAFNTTQGRIFRISFRVAVAKSIFCKETIDFPNLQRRTLNQTPHSPSAPYLRRTPPATNKITLIPVLKKAKDNPPSLTKFLMILSFVYFGLPQFSKDSTPARWLVIEVYIHFGDQANGWSSMAWADKWLVIATMCNSTQIDGADNKNICTASGILKPQYSSFSPTETGSPLEMLKRILASGPPTSSPSKLRSCLMRFCCIRMCECLGILHLLRGVFFGRLLLFWFLSTFLPGETVLPSRWPANSCVLILLKASFFKFCKCLSNLASSFILPTNLCSEPSCRYFLINSARLEIYVSDCLYLQDNTLITNGAAKITNNFYWSERRASFREKCELFLLVRQASKAERRASFIEKCELFLLVRQASKGLLLVRKTKCCECMMSCCALLDFHDVTSTTAMLGTYQVDFLPTHCICHMKYSIFSEDLPPCCIQAYSCIHMLIMSKNKRNICETCNTSSWMVIEVWPLQITSQAGVLHKTSHPPAWLCSKPQIYESIPHHFICASGKHKDIEPNDPATIASLINFSFSGWLSQFFSKGLRKTLRHSTNAPSRVGSCIFLSPANSWIEAALTDQPCKRWSNPPPTLCPPSSHWSEGCLDWFKEINPINRNQTTFQLVLNDGPSITLKQSLQQIKTKFFSLQVLLILLFLCVISLLGQQTLRNHSSNKKKLEWDALIPGDKILGDGQRQVGRFLMVEKAWLQQSHPQNWWGTVGPTPTSPLGSWLRVYGWLLVSLPDPGFVLADRGRVQVHLDITRRLKKSSPPNLMKPLLVGGCGCHVHFKATLKRSDLHPLSYCGLYRFWVFLGVFHLILYLINFFSSHHMVVSILPCLFSIPSTYILNFTPNTLDADEIKSLFFSYQIICGLGFSLPLMPYFPNTDFLPL